jgi:hypothetical protein
MGVKQYKGGGSSGGGGGREEEQLLCEWVGRGCWVEDEWVEEEVRMVKAALKTVEREEEEEIGIENEGSKERKGEVGVSVNLDSVREKKRGEKNEKKKKEFKVEDMEKTTVWENVVNGWIIPNGLLLCFVL